MSLLHEIKTPHACCARCGILPNDLGACQSWGKTYESHFWIWWDPKQDGPSAVLTQQEARRLNREVKTL